MKKSLTALFYLIAFAAASYFLREYLQAPRSFIISLIISLAIILYLVQQRSRYLLAIGATLLIGHAIRLIGIFIPVYEHTPDIRQRYRRNPSMLRATADASPDIKVTLSQRNGQVVQGTAPGFSTDGVPVYQGDSITVAGPSDAIAERMMLTFRDGSHAQIFPQSDLKITLLTPDFGSLTGSRIGLTLTRGIITMDTLRRSYDPAQRFVKANEIYFSCDSCLIALSGTAGSIVSNKPIAWRIDDSEVITLSGGTYTFATNSVLASPSTVLESLHDQTENTAVNRVDTYDDARREFIMRERGWSMDTSILLSYLSKVKMALVGIVDRTYRERYENLALYEYLRDDGETVPPPFAQQQHLYEFTE